MQTTGWPPGLLQDDSRELSWWLSTRLGAKYQLQRNNMQTNKTPEALAEEILRAASDFAAAKLALYGRQDPSLGNPADLLDDLKFAINRLRDMAASGAKFNAWPEAYPDGMTEQDVKNELHDYQQVLEQVPKVYDHVTGGLLSKPNYLASVVISAADDHLNKMVEEALEEAKDDNDGESVPWDIRGKVHAAIAATKRG